jgi:hypothetical protein
MRNGMSRGGKKNKKTKKFEIQKQYRRLDWKLYTVPSCIIVTGKWTHRHSSHPEHPGQQVKNWLKKSHFFTQTNMESEKKIRVENECKVDTY